MKHLHIEKLRQKLYADSPFDLATDEDNAYRDGVDQTLDEIEKHFAEGGIV